LFRNWAFVRFIRVEVRVAAVGITRVGMRDGCQDKRRDHSGGGESLTNDATPRLARRLLRAVTAMILGG
jgi:hypothetical protein